MTAKPREKRPRGRRPLSEEERALWDHVTQLVKPLRRRRRLPVKADDAPALSTGERAPPVPAVVPSLAPPPRPRPAPPLAPIEKRLKQRVARGSLPIDARIDLHGMTQERAHRALARFLRTAQAEDLKLILVITGKGARGPGGSAPDPERGVLRRVVPHWLELPELRPYVVGYEPAHVAHGGDGALYVRVRRRR